MSINRAFNRLVGGQERVEAASDDAFRSAPAREREEGRSKSDCRRRKRVDRLPVLTVRPANVWRLCGRADRARAQPAFRPPSHVGSEAWGDACAAAGPLTLASKGRRAARSGAHVCTSTRTPQFFSTELSFEDDSQPSFGRPRPWPRPRTCSRSLRATPNRGIGSRLLQDRNASTST